MKTDIRIFKNSETLSREAADIFVEAASEAIQTRERFLTALSGGGTPAGLFRLLATESYSQKIDWLNTFVFWADERCVPPEDAESNYHQAMDTFLSHVPIPDENILRIRGELEPAEAANRYVQTLKRFASPPLDWPRFDLALLGMGDDGHTASLFPGSPVDVSASAIAVSADYQERPAQRVTLTPPVLNAARKVLFLVAGASKAVTLSRVLSDVSMPEQYPAQRIQPKDGQLLWLVDQAASSKLK